MTSSLLSPPTPLTEPRARQGRCREAEPVANEASSSAAPLAGARTLPAEPLLTLRRAAWGFLSSTTRPASLGAFLTETDADERSIASARERLVAAFHEAVPQAPDARTRRGWLATKRAIFNGRPLDPDSPSPPWLEAEVERYRELFDRVSSSEARWRPVVVAEIRRRLEALTSRADFAAALAASSPDLLADLAARAEASDELTSLDRGLYAYLARFTSKANPFHLFATWQGVNPPSEGPGYEVLFDTEGLLALERFLLGRAGAADRAWLQLRPCRQVADRWEIWLPGEGGWQVARLRPNPALDSLIALFATERGSTRAAVLPRTVLRERLAARLAAEGTSPTAETIDAFLAQLEARGVLAPFLIRDLSSPAGDLLGLDPEADRQLERVAELHTRRFALGQVAPAELEPLRACARLDRQLAESVLPLRHYVNRFAADDLAAAHRASDEVASPLAQLRPVFEQEHNFSPVDRVLHAFYAEELGEGGEAPFLDLLATFLRRRAELLERHGWGREAPAYVELRERCTALHGELSEPALERLLATLPSPGAGRSLCAAGPFDFEERVFYPTNLFAGDGRFASRYELARRRATPRGASAGPGLDVELVPPPVPSLNFVLQRFDVGCGFEERWGGSYEEWIEPASIQVRWSAGQVRYRDERGGRELRFHPRGFLLAQYLPVEYQLLLVGHADSYRNPFEEVAPTVFSPGERFVRAIPELRFGPICLRRAAWHVAREAVVAALEGAGTLAATARLRRFVGEHCAEGEELWFYAVPGAGRRAAKPRLLDLLDPLSVLAFRRAIATPEGAAPGAAAGPTVVLTVMRPAPDGLWEHAGDRYAHELMVEV
jgi:hypothetical protein